MSGFSARVLYTKQVQKKRKTWQDGYLSIHSQDRNNRSGRLFDEDGKQITTTRIPASVGINGESEGECTNEACAWSTQHSGLVTATRFAGITVFDGFMIEIDALCDHNDILNANTAGTTLSSDKETQPKSSSASLNTLQQPKICKPDNSRFMRPKFIRPRLAGSHTQLATAAVGNARQATQHPDQLASPNKPATGSLQEPAHILPMEPGNKQAKTGVCKHYMRQLINTVVCSFSAPVPWIVQTTRFLHCFLEVQHVLLQL